MYVELQDVLVVTMMWYRTAQLPNEPTAATPDMATIHCELYGPPAHPQC
jgi:hypothetical protein